MSIQNPIIFIGPGRCGSTVISEVIFAHESLAWPSNHMEFYPQHLQINLLRRLFDNNYWRMTGEKAQLNKTRFMNLLLPYPAEAYEFWNSVTRPEIDFSRGFLLGETATEQEAARIRNAVAKIVRWQGKQRFAMKITGPGRIGYLQSIFPDACFINVVRDPVANVHSLVKAPFWQELGMHRLWWQGAYTRDELDEYKAIMHNGVASTAFQLAKVLQTTAEEAKACQAKMLTISYEQFVASPHGVIDEVCRFVGLSVSSAIEQKLAHTKVHDRNKQPKRLASEDEKIVMHFMERVHGLEVAL